MRGAIYPETSNSPYILGKTIWFLRAIVAPHTSQKRLVFLTTARNSFTARDQGSSAATSRFAACHTCLQCKIRGNYLETYSQLAQPPAESLSQGTVFSYSLFYWIFSTVNRTKPRWKHDCSDKKRGVVSQAEAWWPCQLQHAIKFPPTSLSHRVKCVGLKGCQGLPEVTPLTAINSKQMSYRSQGEVSLFPGGVRKSQSCQLLCTGAQRGKKNKLFRF